MKLLIFTIILTVILAICFLVIQNPIATSRKLAKKFADLEDINNMHMNNIIVRVGRPFSNSLVGKERLLQWMSAGYHISILFDANGFFKSVMHESYVG